MAYASASDVSALCQNLLGSEDQFSVASSPTLNEIRSWLSSGCAIIEAHLSSFGYSIPVLSSATVYDYMRQLNTLYAAAYAENSRSSVTIGIGERTRGQVFERTFWDNLDKLRYMDLSRAGVSRASTGGRVYVGGIDVDEKDTYDSDTGRVLPRFRRGMQRYPGKAETAAS